MPRVPVNDNLQTGGIGHGKGKVAELPLDCGMVCVLHYSEVGMTMDMCDRAEQSSEVGMAMDM